MSLRQISNTVWQVHAGAFPANSYICRDEVSGDLLLIDTGLDVDPIAQAIDAVGGRLKAIVCTHGHFDHMGTAAAFQDQIGVDVYLHADDLKIAKTANFLLMAFKIPAKVKTPQFTLFDGNIGSLDIGGIAVHYRHVPGHTPGSCFIEVADACFTGDSLYALGVGLSNTPGEQPDVLRSSLTAVLDKIAPDTLICPGHGPTALFHMVRSDNQALKRFLASAAPAGA